MTYYRTTIVDIGPEAGGDDRRRASSSCSASPCPRPWPR